ncbi:MAG: geranylgeranylglyceryl/heptaprenylglyceryl phosphate synthase [bacterium TMED217]|nr:MAG: geranylgeranylglyceryl/heptaprenylglyceryl phosphate synthase [bacterium TMED217]
MSVLSNLNKCIENKGAGFIILIDPDKKNDEKIDQIVESANDNDVDAIFVGGSIMMDRFYHKRIERIKHISDIPVILFPGGVNQVNKYYDAMLFMSLMSGRNPHYLIGEQVIAAPIVNDFGLETIPTGYLLIDGGSPTTVEFISGTKPLPSNRPDIIISHALAAQFMGMQLLYLEAGSGAMNTVPVDVISKVSNETSLSLVVGGGIRTPKDALEIVNAGASFVVIGSAIEKSLDLIKDFSSAIHFK